MNKHCCLIGVDLFSIALAKLLQEEGIQVTLVDKNQHNMNDLIDDFSNLIICDVSDFFSVKNCLDVKIYDHILLGNYSSLEESIVACSNLISLNGKNIMADVLNHRHEKILEHMGIVPVFCGHQNPLSIALSWTYDVKACVPDGLGEFAIISCKIKTQIAAVKIKTDLFIQSLQIVKAGGTIQQFSEESILDVGDVWSVLIYVTQIKNLMKVIG